MAPACQQQDLGRKVTVVKNGRWRENSADRQSYTVNTVFFFATSLDLVLTRGN